MKKKMVSLVLASAMAMSLAASVGVQAEDNTLTVWTWDPNFNIYAMEKAAEIYAANGHEGFSLEITEISSNDIETKITTAVNAGDLSTLPDIFLMQDNSFQKYTSFYPDVFTDLTDSGIDFSQFAAGKTAYSTQGDVHYGVPFDNGTVLHFIRRDYIEEAGFTVEDFTDITWTDYIEKAKVVLEKTGHPMLSGQTQTAETITMALESSGQSMFNEDGSVNIKDNEALKEIIGYYKEMVEAGVFQEVADSDQYNASFNNGTVGGVINGCWMMATVSLPEDQAGKWAVVNMPKMDNQPNATNYSNQGGSSWAVSSTCENKELAIDFLNSTFAGSNELYDDIIQKGALATWLPAADSDVYNQEVEYWGNDTVYAKIVEYASKTPVTISNPFYYDARDAVCTAIANIIQSGADIDSELQIAQETVEFNMGF